MTAHGEGLKVVATNRRARHRYVIEDRYEAGLELKGSEVKSLRDGLCSIEESFARPVGREIYLLDMHIPPYERATVDVPDPKRRRKLLLHRREVDRIVSQCTRRGYTLVPLRVYFKRGWAKVELALARSRPQADKRRKKQQEQTRRDAARELARRRRRRA